MSAFGRLMSRPPRLANTFRAFREQWSNVCPKALSGFRRPTDFGVRHLSRLANCRFWRRRVTSCHPAARQAVRLCDSQRWYFTDPGHCSCDIRGVATASANVQSA